ncbi:MAG: rod shape-determining protein MreD [Bacteroidetes bacterium GWF2_42_66]|nr:MAG: rod shape-determining protein MreD [Bacteroidetes bacterium GWA2_42_15]OFY03560.1 MAG: rod shape-determining protein MreD [Bacteroidetes bacterium GWE2_42_39]OFY45925.1 MAG: rod shape-determining protein MreD [Bacteroidetes bacterium GWF2_42_66]HBL75167.1 rod shape-determining protein MreD [Prolixibacteraceae bacterium]HCR89718.1 rod shape-determining protein MreD [Prolixibacteraceae bacterium]
MIKDLIKYTIMFVVLVLIQVLVLNNIQLSGYINPFLYILFILLLPFQTPVYLLLFLGFILGLTIDIFGNTPGIHSSATVFLAFIRPYVLELISGRDNPETGFSPRMKTLGIAWFIKYTVILVLCHHIFLFYIEVFTFSGAFYTLLRCLLSSVLSIILVIISQYIIFKN